jgi:hydroxymethylbilane synthase
VIVGSRGSPLALRQTEIVLDHLRKLGVATELKIVRTSGDLFLDRPMHEVSGRGIFVREIDELMLSGEIDLAVHSMKDMPTKRPNQLPIAAVLKRDSPFDLLVSRDGSTLEELKRGAIVGTSSMRRRAQLNRARPDLVVRGLRGNLGTRLRKLNESDYDAIVVAQAGIERMGYPVESSLLDPMNFVPSPNQGAIAVVAVGGSELEGSLSAIDDPTTRMETIAERIILDAVGGGCVVPMSAYAKRTGDELRVISEVLSLGGERYVRLDERIKVDNYLEESLKLGRRLVEMGGRALVEEAVRVIGPR